MSDRIKKDQFGHCHWIPLYIPDHWLNRIRVEWHDGKPHYLWTGWNNGDGHGKVRHAGKAIYCYRDVVERVTGVKLTRFQYVDHKCACKPCLNFDCLEVVPPGVNTQRGPGRHTQFKPAADYPAPSPSCATWLEPLDGL